MDTDGVDIEVLYCEVSAYRYLYLMKSGAPEATRAFNDTLLDFASADPERLVVTVQVPIHDIDFAIAEVAARRRRWAASRCSCRCSRPSSASPTTSTSATTGCGPRSPRRVCRSAATSGSTPRSTTSRTATPRRAWRGRSRACRSSACEALGMWLLTGHLQALPRAEGRVRRARARLGRRGTSRSSTTWCCARATSSRCSRRAAELLLPPQHGDDVHRRARSRPHLRHRLGAENLMWSSDYPHPVSTWPKSAATRRAVRRPARRHPRRHRLPQRRTHLEPLTEIHLVLADISGLQRPGMSARTSSGSEAAAGRRRGRAAPGRRRWRPSR